MSDSLTHPSIALYSGDTLVVRNRKLFSHPFHETIISVNPKQLSQRHSPMRQGHIIAPSVNLGAFCHIPSLSFLYLVIHCILVSPITNNQFRKKTKTRALPRKKNSAQEKWLQCWISQLGYSASKLFFFLSFLQGSLMNRLLDSFLLTDARHKRRECIFLILVGCVVKLAFFVFEVSFFPKTIDPEAGLKVALRVGGWLTDPVV